MLKTHVDNVSATLVCQLILGSRSGRSLLLTVPNRVKMLRQNTLAANLMGEETVFSRTLCVGVFSILRNVFCALKVWDSANYDKITNLGLIAIRYR